MLGRNLGGGKDAQGEFNNERLFRVAKLPFIIAGRQTIIFSRENFRSRSRFALYALRSG